jgi:hypothetical protein
VRVSDDVAFVRIALEIVEHVRSRALAEDQLEAAFDDRATGPLGACRLREHRAIVEGLAAQERRERAPRGAGQRLRARELEDRRRDIDERDVLRQPARRDPRGARQKRHAQDVVVEGRPVMGLAVIGGDDEQRMFESDLLFHVPFAMRAR